MKHHILAVWVPIALASTIFFGTIYATVQQNFRQSANDPQIQLAEDGAAALGGGFSASSLVGNAHVDMSHSLSPFVIVYDDTGHAVASSGYLNDSIPVPPTGVFDFARIHTDDRLTWQPAADVRIAAVVKHFEGKSPGFIIAGRSLREIEIRENFVGLAALAGWIVTVIVTMLAVVYAYMVGRKNNTNE